MKIDTSKLTPELITELCKDENIKQTLINNGVVKNELEAGKWYKFEGGTLGFYQGDNVNSYGFHGLGKEWFDAHRWFFNENLKENLTLATPQEVETALKNEAVKRGFIYGVTHTIVDGPRHIISKDNRFGFDENRSSLLFNNWCVFKDGKWAEIIKKETNDIEVVDPTIVSEKCVSIPFSTIDTLSNNFNLGDYVRKIRNESC